MTLQGVNFYKFLNKCGLSYDEIHNSITLIIFIHLIFVKTENNNGWGEIVGTLFQK